MSNAAVQYRFRIYSTDDSTVETTFDDELQGWDAVGGQEVRPLEGRAETRPWSISVVDYSTAVTNDLADSSGRMRRIGRLVDFQQNLDSSGWATLATGRISDVFLGDDVASYRFVMEDEHSRARNTVVFTSTSHTPTCYVYPPGLRDYWAGIPPRQLGNARVLLRAGNLSLVIFDSTAPVSLPVMRELDLDFRQSTHHAYDTNATVGNFRYLRFHGDGTDYEVFGLGANLKGTVPDLLALTKLPPEEMKGVPTWVVDPSTTLAGGQTYPVSAANSTIGVIRSAYLYSPGAPPSDAQPWHIGGRDGEHPFEIQQDLYDNVYGGTTSTGAILRYDSTALTTLINNKLLPLVCFRITSPRGLAEFSEAAIYGTFGVVPFVSRDGRIMPRSLFMPSTVDVDQTALARLTGSTMRDPHPSWQHTRREMVTVLEIPRLFPRQVWDREVVQRNYDLAADFVEPEGLPNRGAIWGPPPAHPIYPLPYVHDRLGVGRVVHRIPSEAVTADWQWTALLAREIFDRYGDGPIQGEVMCLSSGTSGILPGDFVRINLATYPNMAIQGRGSTRIVQILSAMDTPHGPVFDYLDAGPDQGALSAPTVTMSSSTEASPSNKHTLNVTLGGVPAYEGAGIELQIAQDAGGLSVPTSNSTRWRAVGHFTSSGQYPVDRLPAGGDYWTRARTRAPGFWRSPWAYSTTFEGTDTLVAPSGVATSTPTIVSVNVSWANSTASTGYPLQIAYQTSAGANFTNVDSLPAGTNRYSLQGMSSSTGTRSVAVRYYDPFGGFSNQAASSAFASTSRPTAATVSAIALTLGINTTGESY